MVIQIYLTDADVARLQRLMELQAKTIVKDFPPKTIEDAAGGALYFGLDEMLKLCERELKYTEDSKAGE